MNRRAFITLSKSNLILNITRIKELVQKAKIVSMIKSNAYGHGLEEVGHCLEGYTDLLGVRSLEEAFTLSKQGIKTPLLLAQGIRNSYELIEASKNHFHVVIHNHNQIEWLQTLSLPSPITCWLKINTGMNRLGFNTDDGDIIYAQLKNNKNIKDIILMSHFACAETKEHPLNKEQITIFKKHTDHLSVPRTMSNSAAIFNFPECHFDYVRPGIALYGISPIPEKSSLELGLKPIMTFYSSLICVKTVTKGSTVGYTARYTCPETMPVGIIGCGYADGYPLTLTDGAPVLIRDTICPIIGRISMDMIAVDLRNVPAAKIDDTVIMWGEDLSLDNIVPYTGQSSYTILAGMISNVPYEWIL